MNIINNEKIEKNKIISFLRFFIFLINIKNKTIPKNKINEFKKIPCLKNKDVEYEIIDKKVIPKIPRFPKSEIFIFKNLLIINP